MKTDHLSPLQIEAIENWDGHEVLSLYPQSSVRIQSFENSEEERFQADEYYAAMKKLDDWNIPRNERITEKLYSLVGRIGWLANHRGSILPKKIRSGFAKILKK